MAERLINQPTTLTNTSEIGICYGSSFQNCTVLSVIFCNNETDDDGTFDLRIMDSSDSNAHYYIYKDQPLPSKATFEHTDRIVLNAGDILKVKMGATGNNVTVVCFYLEQS